MNRAWPLHVHLNLIVWALFFMVGGSSLMTLFGHVFVLSVPPWILGRAMAGAYAPRPEPPP